MRFFAKLGLTPQRTLMRAMSKGLDWEQGVVTT